MTKVLIKNLNRRDLMSKRTYSSTESKEVVLSKKIVKKALPKDKKELKKDSVKKIRDLKNNFLLFKYLSELLPVDIYYKFGMSDVIPQCSSNKPFNINVYYKVKAYSYSKTKPEQVDSDAAYTIQFKVILMVNSMTDVEVCKNCFNQGILLKRNFLSVKIDNAKK